MTKDSSPAPLQIEQEICDVVFDAVVAVIREYYDDPCTGGPPLDECEARLMSVEVLERICLLQRSKPLTDN